MLPVDSDPFLPSDFVATMNKLDGTPGVTPIANFASLPVGLTTAQHGSMYMQTDNNAMWMWWKPTSGSTGAWKRANNLGVLGQATLSTSVTTTASSDGAAPTVMTLTVAAPGGRWIGCDVHCWSVGNTGSAGATVSSLSLNGTIVTRGAVVTGTAGAGALAHLTYFMPPPAAGTSVTFRWTIRVANIVGGLGSSTATGPANLTIFEV